jgi:hypothetical protein
MTAFDMATYGERMTMVDSEPGRSSDREPGSRPRKWAVRAVQLVALEVMKDRALALAGTVVGPAWVALCHWWPRHDTIWTYLAVAWALVVGVGVTVTWRRDGGREAFILLGVITVPAAVATGLWYWALSSGDQFPLILAVISGSVSVCMAFYSLIEMVHPGAFDQDKESMDLITM